MANQVLNLIFTNVGRQLMVDRKGQTVILNITHISLGDSSYTVTGAETKLKTEKYRTTLVHSGNPNPYSIQFRTTFKANQGTPFWAKEVGLWEDNTLVAIGSGTIEPFYISDKIDTTVSFTFTVDTIDTDSVNVVFDEKKDLLSLIVSQHEQAADPHPQYVKKTTQITVGDGLTGGGSLNSDVAIGLADTGVDAGTYQSVTVNNKGIITGGGTVETGLVTAPLSSFTSNSNSYNTNTYINVVETTGKKKTSNGTSVRLQGTGATNVSSSNGVISIDSPVSDFNFKYNLNQGSSGDWTTAEFIAWLKTNGAFSRPGHWVLKQSFVWNYSKIIKDTGCGDIKLAGNVIEVISENVDNYMIRVTTLPAVDNDGGTIKAQFIYFHYQATGGSPGWVKFLTNLDKSNSVTSTSSDTVATSYAVKTAYDKAVDGVNKADAAQTAANKAQTTANAAIPISKKSDSVTSASSDTVATSKAVKTAYDKAVDALNVANTKLGATATAVAANKLATARTISLTGAVSGSGSFDGSGNLSINTADNLTVGLVTSTSSTGISNTTTSNGNTYLNVVETRGGAANAVGSSTRVTGTGLVDVYSDSSGVLTVRGNKDNGKLNTSGNQSLAGKLTVDDILLASNGNRSLSQVINAFNCLFTGNRDGLKNIVNSWGQSGTTPLGVSYDFSNANAWWINFGPLYGGLIIQGGHFDCNAYYADITLPVKFKTECLSALAYDVLYKESTRAVDSFLFMWNYGKKDSTSLIRFLNTGKPYAGAVKYFTFGV
ncbi:phage tail-collar fiber domain-containing protein [Gallibacterium sp. ZY190522]